MAAADTTLLRHALATLAYRSRKVLADVPEGFAAFRPSADSRSAAEILAHMGDLFDWALTLAEDRQEWHNAQPLPWNDESARFYAALQKFDDRLAASTELKSSCLSLFQGPVADALTHLGQIAMLRRLAQAPTRGENYFKAEILVGRIDPATQVAPRREF